MADKILIDLSKYPDLAEKLEALANKTQDGNVNRTIRELIRKSDGLLQGQSWDGSERRKSFLNKAKSKQLIK